MAVFNGGMFSLNCTFVFCVVEKFSPCSLYLWVIERVRAGFEKKFGWWSSPLLPPSPFVAWKPSPHCFCVPLSGVSVLLVNIWYFHWCQIKKFLAFNKCVTLNKQVNFKCINLWNSAPFWHDLRIQQDLQEQRAQEHKQSACTEDALKRGRHHLFLEISGDMSE